MRINFFQFIFKKVIEVLLAVWVLATLLFFFLRLLPGGPFDQEKKLNPIVQKSLEDLWGLNSPLGSQYWSYIKGLFRGDLGVSMIRPDHKVVEIIWRDLQNTFLLSILAIAFIYLGSFFITFFWAPRRDIWSGKIIDQILIALVSLPSLFVAPVLIYIFANYLNILPVALLETPLHFILPVLSLAVRPMAALARLLQKSMSTQFYAQYVQVAKAKGLSSSQILIRHIYRNSLIAVLGYSGTLIVSLVSGSFLVESLFAIPGLGTDFITSLYERDYTLITGLTLFYGILLIVSNNLFDLVMRLVDPRIKERL